MSKLRKKLEARKDNRRYQETRFILKVLDKIQECLDSTDLKKKKKLEDADDFLGDQDNDLTPAQAEALDRAAARPPVKIKCRDLPKSKERREES